MGVGGAIHPHVSAPLIRFFFKCRVLIFNIVIILFSGADTWGCIAPPPWTLSHPDFLDKGVPVSENPKFPKKNLERNARFGQFSHFKGQKHPKNFELFYF